MVKTASLFPMGRDWELPRPTQTEVSSYFTSSGTTKSSLNDHFIRRDGRCFAGTHLIIDLWQASYLDDEDHIHNSLREAVTQAKANLLHIHLRRFTPSGGFSGIAILAESHISVHTWPERDYAALDIFMCGAAQPHKAINVLIRAFSAKIVIVTDIQRGEEP